MTTPALSLNGPETHKRYPVIPTIETPSALFQTYLARKHELIAADAHTESIEDDRSEEYREAETAAQEIWSQKIDAAYAVADRKIETDQDLLELALVVADCDIKGLLNEQLPTYRIELVQALLNRIFERGTRKQNCHTM